MVGKSLKKMVFLSGLLIAWGAICLVGGLWVWDAYTSRVQAISTLRTEIMDSSRQALKSEVGLVVDYIESMQGQARQRLEHSLKDRVDDIHAMIKGLYEQYSATMTDAELIALIREAVRPMSYNSGRGYYFITTMQGVSVLLPPFPEMEGKSYIKEDEDGRFNPIAEIITQLLERDRMIYSYMWPLPETGEEELKISYIRRFDPLAIYVGAGDYVRFVEQDIQQEVLGSLENLRFKNDDYVFAATYDGISLMGPGKGRNMWDIHDANGVAVVQELVALSRQGGGFLQYVLPPIDEKHPSVEKVSYVEPITDWDWYVGVGMGLNALNDLVEVEVAETRRSVFQHIGIILLMLGTVSAVVFLAGRRFTSFLWGELAVFSFMLGRAVKDDERMDENRLRYDEMVKMARTANEMLEGRRLAVQRSEALKRHLQDIIDSMPSVLLAVDGRGRVSQWNRAAVEEFGNGLRVGMDAALLVPAVDGLLRRALEQAEPVEHMAHASEAGETGIYRDVVVYPLGESEGTCAVVRVDNVTERVRLEQMARHGEKMSTVGALAAGMAHEINNPLGIILQSGQGINRRLADGIPGNEAAARECGVSLEQLRRYMHIREIDSYLEALMDAGKRASAIVRNLLSFSKDELSGVEACDLNPLLDRVLELAESDYDLRQQLDFRSVDIRREYGDALPAVAGVASELEQVFLNIIKNSIQAMAGNMPAGQQPMLMLRTRRQDGKVLTEIEDNGPGMDEETRQRVFEPFFTTHEPGRGVGLGLSVSYFIITRNHAGEIRVASRPGQGTRFSILLPVFDA